MILDKIATQIYPFRHDFSKNMPATLEKIKKMGFGGVELCRFFDWTDTFDKWPVEEIREVCQKIDLRVISAHIMSKMIYAEKLAELTEFCKIFGMKYVIVASIPEEKVSTHAGLTEMIAVFNHAATTLKSEGIRVGYHNHGPDFRPINGEMPWEILFDNLDPDVIMQMDNGNAMRAGADPIYYLKKYPGKASLVHIKEYAASGKPMAAIGDGDVDWEALIQVCEEFHQPEWYILEQEEDDFDPWNCAEKSLEFLRDF